ncbi:SDR family NAD(P)-dependent oxidoreductase [Hymenobacter sp. HSC-4F20]|uniref:SDR family NAD(P)-dependent oxidoreductase n=1 Tax=Hymenobacter sp. HSC-4F20 TaxID=2864135 RepID=UPI001C72CBE6|nr:SDR family NAD(P)-dependent oxidoreductase [Hymenobacter sp. HSC-4F20]MBX0291249.1 SDR family NAD(P)-dependent oxidoreductase [Hymenobacter sp. HSC-4F20]
MAIPTQPLALVTGATSGIGEVTARELARQGYHVVLLARSAEKAARARQQMQALVGLGRRVDVLLCDLADLSQVRRAAAEFTQRYQRLDVLVNNAGRLFGQPRQVSTAGIELTLATNYLGPFLLTALLLQALRQSPAARIINVASMAYKMAKPRLDDLHQEQDYSPLQQYSNTKLFNIMFTQELARQLRQRGIGNVVSNSLHPGAIASNFGAHAAGWLATGTQLLRPFMISPDQGAETTLYLATAPEMGAISGGFFAKKKAEPVKHDFNTAEHAWQLWQETQRLVHQNFFS